MEKLLFLNTKLARRITQFSDKDRQYKNETETDGIKTRFKKRIIPHKNRT